MNFGRDIQIIDSNRGKEVQLFKRKIPGPYPSEVLLFFHERCAHVESTQVFRDREAQASEGLPYAGPLA
jgi:hypothetical protein